MVYPVYFGDRPCDSAQCSSGSRYDAQSCTFSVGAEPVMGITMACGYLLAVNVAFLTLRLENKDARSMKRGNMAVSYLHVYNDVRCACPR